MRITLEIVTPWKPWNICFVSVDSDFLGVTSSNVMMIRRYEQKKHKKGEKETIFIKPSP